MRIKKFVLVAIAFALSATTVMAGGDTNDLEKLKKDAERGNAEAQFSLGVKYYKGKDVTKNLREAARYFKLAADQGNASAQSWLGECYFDGEGVQQNYQEAVKYLKLAAEQGKSRAQYYVGYCYSNGKGVPVNYEEAAKYYKQSADQGYSYAQVGIANLYQRGDGVPLDYNEAAKYFKLAAEQGDKDALAELGKCYVYGLGVPVNYEEAKNCFEQAKSDMGENNYKTLMNICNLKGRIYYGIGKLPGNPMDLALEFDVNGNVMNFNFGHAVKKNYPCKWVQNGNNVRLEISTPDGKTAVLDSSDDGESFNGKMDFNGKQMQIWVLKDFPHTFTCKINPSLLNDVLAKDTYTAFCEMETSGQTACMTGEFKFGKDGSFKLICDSPEVQKMFGNFKGTYKVGKDGELLLKTVAGPVLEGSIRGQGNKIIVPVGSKGGMKLTMKLIR